MATKVEAALEAAVEAVVLLEEDILSWFVGEFFGKTQEN